MLQAELGGGVQASVDLADHLKLELAAVVPSWYLGSFAVQSAYLLTGAKCLGLWSCLGGSLHILLDPHGGPPTEVYEAGFTVTMAEWDVLLPLLPAGQTVVCGSLPPGCSPEQFTALLTRLDRPVVDSSGPGLRAAVKADVPMITPNTHELAQLTGSGTTESAQDLYRETGVQVLLTRGEAGAVYVGEETWEALAPEIQVRNPVGSGDAFLGAFLYARQQGDTIPESLRLTVGTGSANAMLGGPLNLRAEVARDLASRVQVSRRT